MHQSGFVNIIGRPNVGKSTLMNALVGEKLSIITPKAQTTRHRIFGILNGEDFQIVFSDSPGIIIKPVSGLHEAMMKTVESSFKDGDIIMLITEPGEPIQQLEEALNKIKSLEIPKYLVLNKIDKLKKEELLPLLKHWDDQKIFDHVFPVSALKKRNTDELLRQILKDLPENPAWYPKDQLTDRPERFFVSEIIREKIFIHYKQEIPYSCEIVTEAFEEEEKIIRIHSIIYTERESQKNIIIGKKGSGIKRIGTEARKDMERFFEKKIYLELFVKVKEKWRDNPNQLRQFGY
ncbi:MAG: GTPase Era [Chitinophagales bacterium]